MGVGHAVSAWTMKYGPTNRKPQTDSSNWHSPNVPDATAGSSIDGSSKYVILLIITCLDITHEYAKEMHSCFMFFF